MADATASAVIELTTTGDIDAVAALYDAETGIATPVVDPGADLLVDIPIAATSVTSALAAQTLLTNAVTAVGNGQIKPKAADYPGAGAVSGVTMTCDAPTLTAADIAPTQAAAAVEVTDVITAVQKFGAVVTFSSDIDISAIAAGLNVGTITLTDNGNDTATLAVNAEVGDEGVYVITITATDGLGQTVDEVVTLTIT